ncbi:hypothetical protein CkaCkLH20_13303 [Colletotrichum karsti]|uniref:Uncharacterized protein n=1 Tax=Colletotrichum karsti TaxID=1095194 RepID=A0A9P6HSI6_9PEZI|nr:uncharacterized protein CkaCkLH20_13303 [Colletotrichum karsti]KAF9869224.1 hypothetical protein CkaCkLH20_13303 [Colletotrichum karsti]
MPSCFFDSVPDPFLDPISAPPRLKALGEYDEDSVATVDAFEPRRSIADVLHQQSTSKWSKRHFDVCNAVVTQQEHDILPGLRPGAGNEEQDVAWPHWGRTNLSDEDHPFWSKYGDTRRKLLALVSGPPSDISTSKSASFLCRNQQSDVGFIWAALRKFRTLHLDSETTDTEETTGNSTQDILHDDSESPPAKRVRRKPALHPGVVSYAGGDLSDPLDSQSTTPPAKSWGGDLPSTPEEPAFISESENRRSSQKPETLTAEFIYAFIRHVLQWLPPQHEMAANDQESIVDLNVATARRFVSLSGPLKFTSIDDGGLYIGSLGCVAIIEMKQCLQIVDGQAKVPDEWVAQIVGEALAVRLEDGAWAGPPETVFVIAPARHYARLFELNITDNYLTEFKRDAMRIAPGDYISMDFFVISKAYNNEKVIILIRDEWSGFAWIRGLRARKEGLQALSQIVAFLERQYTSLLHIAPLAPAVSATLGLTPHY